MDDSKAIGAAARALAVWNDEEPDAKWPFDGAFTYAQVNEGAARAAVQAYLAHMEAEEGQVMVPVEVLKFLYGRGPLEGVWFGDRHPTRQGQYWWRPVIRAMLSARPQRSE